MKIEKTRKGFTLIEVLAYIAVLAMIILAVSSFLLWAVRSNTKTKVTRETLDNIRETMEIITYEIKEAENIYTPTSVFDSHPGQLSLKTAKYLPVGEDTTYIDFYVSDGHVCLKKESQNPIVLTSDRVRVTNLVFSQIAGTPSSVQIDLEIEFQGDVTRPEYQSIISTTSVASLRSY